MLTRTSQKTSSPDALKTPEHLKAAARASRQPSGPFFANEAHLRYASLDWPKTTALMLFALSNL